MLTNKKRVEMCYSLLSAMLPGTIATNFGFDKNPEKRIFLAYSNQIPRPEVETILYFSIKDEAYKQARSDPYHYNGCDIQVMEQMRQITLTIDVYSKSIPIGMANDVVHWLNSALISELFEDWRQETCCPLVIESIELMPDLSYLLEGNVWNNRAQLVVKLNYRDTVKMGKLYFTRRPIDLADTPNSVNAQTILKK